MLVHLTRHPLVLVLELGSDHRDALLLLLLQLGDIGSLLLPSSNLHHDVGVVPHHPRPLVQQVDFPAKLLHSYRTGRQLVY